MEWDGEQCTCDIDGETYYYTPRSNHLSEILKILKYKTREQHLERLTKRQKPSNANDTTGQGKQSRMNVNAALKVNGPGNRGGSNL